MELPKEKNRHLLEVARALLFSSKVPYYLWGEAVLTAAYLINRMPSKVLNFQTSINTFKECFPSTRVSTDLALKSLVAQPLFMNIKMLENLNHVL